MNEFRHEEGAVTRIFPQPEGSRMVFEDDKGHLYVFNPVNDQVRRFLKCISQSVSLHSCPPSTLSVLLLVPSRF